MTTYNIPYRKQIQHANTEAELDAIVLCYTTQYGHSAQRQVQALHRIVDARAQAILAQTSAHNNSTDPRELVAYVMRCVGEEHTHYLSRECPVGAFLADHALWNNALEYPRLFSAIKQVVERKLLAITEDAAIDSLLHYYVETI